MGAHNQISALRKQFGQMLKETAGKPRTAKLAAAANTLDSKLAALAGGSPIPGGTATLATVNGTLAALLNAVESADAAPTAQSYALFEETGRSLQALLASWQKIQQQNMAEVNRLARQSGLQEIKAPSAK
jgi:hypothetical protein